MRNEQLPSLTEIVFASCLLLGACGQSQEGKRDHYEGMIEDVFVDYVYSDLDPKKIDVVASKLNQRLLQAERDGVRFTEPDILSLAMAVNRRSQPTETCRRAYRWDGEPVCAIGEGWRNEPGSLVTLLVESCPEGLPQSPNEEEKCKTDVAKGMRDLRAFCSEQLNSPSSATNACKPTIDEYKTSVLAQNLEIVSRVRDRLLDASDAQITDKQRFESNSLEQAFRFQRWLRLKAMEPK